MTGQARAAGGFDPTDRTVPANAAVTRFFLSSVHRQAIAAIGRGLAQGSGLVVITGEPGSGKSMLAAYLSATLDRRRIRVAELATGGACVDEATTFAGEPQGARRGLLLIDEVERMPLARLAAIARQAAAAAMPWLVVLFARPDLERELARHEQGSFGPWPMVARHRLAPVPPGEVHAFLEHRLRALGQECWPTVNEQLCAAIATVTGGNPASIDRLASRLVAMRRGPGCPRVELLRASGTTDVVAAGKVRRRRKRADVLTLAGGCA